MWRRFRPPLVLVVAALIASIVLLAVLQYKWQGQISEAERAQRRTTLATGAAEFAQDFDREITRAYLLFQADAPSHSAESGALEDSQLEERFTGRYERWQATARFPRMLKEFYAFTQGQSGESTLRRYDPATHTLDVVEWPAPMRTWREQLTANNFWETAPSKSTFFVRRISPAIWENVPALVVPAPMIFMGPEGPKVDLRMNPMVAYSILTIDRDYVTRELLPSLAERYFGHRGDGAVAASQLDFKVAVVSRAASPGLVFQSTPSFAPAFDATADATAEFFQVRTQDFTTLASEVRRFAAFTTTTDTITRGTPGRRLSDTHFGPGGGRPLSILIQPNVTAGLPGGTTTTSTSVTTGTASPYWKLVVAHPAGSLEIAVNSQRRRNLAISSSILGLLGISMGLLVLTTRRAQRLAKQQMEFVAAVSHELRTPLAVIQSAAENLADGVVHDEERIRRYGELMRTEGRRLTEMVEQILELAGIQSGQRGFALRPVAVEPLIGDILSSSSALIERAGLTVDVEIPRDLPPVLGDEPALRRVFQNLLDNAIKYGGPGGWIRLSARRTAADVSVSVADRGIGIEPAEQSKIFEPFYRAASVVAAQMQGAGLGLSLVQRIVAAHGGRVTVTSVPREGSEFTVHLPIAEGGIVTEGAAGTAAVADARGVEAPRYS